MAPATATVLLPGIGMRFTSGYGRRCRRDSALEHDNCARAQSFRAGRPDNRRNGCLQRQRRRCCVVVSPLQPDAAETNSAAADPLPGRLRRALRGLYAATVSRRRLGREPSTSAGGGTLELSLAHADTCTFFGASRKESELDSISRHLAGTCRNFPGGYPGRVCLVAVILQ